MTSQPPYSSDPCPTSINIYAGMRKALVFVLILIGFWVYYPALSLPPSLIDDLAMLDNLDRWMRELKDGGIITAIKNDISVKQKVYNTGFWITSALQNRLSGGQPFHYIRLIQLLLVCGVAWRLLGEQVRSRWSLAVIAAAVFVFFAGEVPGAVDLQSLRANWFRLFASDADVLFWVSLNGLCLLRILKEPNSRWMRFGSAAGFLLTGFIAFSVKIPSIALVLAPALAVSIYDMWSGRRKAGMAIAALSALIAIAFGIYLLTLKSLAPTESSQVYGSNFSLQPSHIWEGVRYYAENYSKITGLMAMGLLGGTILLMPMLWKDRREALPQHRVFIYAAALFIIAVGVYLPWNSRLPRYMLSGYYGFCLMLGVVILQLSSKLGETSYAHKVGILVGAILSLAIALLPPMLAWPAVIILSLLGTWRHPAFAAAFNLSLAVLGFIYMALALPLSRSATNQFYVGREFANWQATKQALKLSAEGKSICFAGDVADEHLGSMWGYIHRFGIEAKFASLGSEQCTSGSIVLVNKWLSQPEEIARFSAANPIFEANLSSPAVKVPVSYEDFRTRIFSGSRPLRYDVWNVDFCWKFFSPALP